MRKLWRFLLFQMAMHISCHVVKANLCLGGQDIFATVRENSPEGEFVANLSIIGDPEANSIRLCLIGDDADWFFLEGKTIRLNSSFSRVLDREAQGSVLLAGLTCYEEETIQSEYRIMVEILNENDNKPLFREETIQPVDISELALVNSLLFTVKATDADGDTIIYVIDKSLPDASYFRIDLPNSGKVILARSLDYETKTQLLLVIYAVEMNTKDKYNTSAAITVNVVDGDDQYPQFQPCSLLSQDQAPPVCTNPVYTVNVTEKEQNITLEFSPGPVHAVDGDGGLRAPLLYTILSGPDSDRFHIDNGTGELVLTRGVENRLLTPTLKLRIMASQLDDPRKYSVATALVHVLAQNRFPPYFNRTAYKGFIPGHSSPASLVYTYGNVVLMVQAIDLDFQEGVNPKIRYSLKSKSNNTSLYRITQDGLLIVQTSQLRAFEKHFLEVLATDLESGEAATASIDIEVLQKGQQVPWSPLEGEARLSGLGVGTATLWGAVLLTLLLLVVFLFVLRGLVWQRQHQDPADRSCVAQGKHPNVMNSGRPLPLPLTEEISCRSDSFCDYEGKHGITANTEDMMSNSVQAPPVLILPQPTPNSVSPSILSNGKVSDPSISKSVSFQDQVQRKETEASAERHLSLQNQGVPSEEGQFVVPPQTASVPQQNASILQNAGSVLQQTAFAPQQSLSAPQQTASSPQQGASVLQQSASSPQQSTSVLQQTASAPQQSLSAPQQSASSPQKTASSPQQSTSALQQSASSPQQSASSPQKTASSPQQNASSPQQNASSPQQNASSPQQNASFPQQNASSPQKTASSPHQNASFPQQNASAPQPAVTAGQQDRPGDKGEETSTEDQSGAVRPLCKTAPQRYTKEQEDSSEGEESENPYKYMHPVICVSDDEDHPPSEGANYRANDWASRRASDGNIHGASAEINHLAGRWASDGNIHGASEEINHLAGRRVGQTETTQGHLHREGLSSHTSDTAENQPSLKDKQRSPDTQPPLAGSTFPMDDAIDI